MREMLKCPHRSFEQARELPSQCERKRRGLSRRAVGVAPNEENNGKRFLLPSRSATQRFTEDREHVSQAETELLAPGCGIRCRGGEQAAP